MTVAALILTTAVLTVHNLGVERLRPALYVPACWVTTAALVAFGLLAGIGAGDLGVLSGGLGAGLALFGATLVVVVVAGLVPATRPFFADRRMAGVGPWATVYRAAVRIPLGTVLVEEVAFRGVLLAVVEGMAPLAGAVFASSVAFGLWHVVPVRATMRTNGRSPGAVPVGAAVVVTATFGAGLCWLRLATGGLLAPALVHASASATATVVAAVTLRRVSRQTATEEAGAPR